MDAIPTSVSGAFDLFEHAALYDRSINWDARLAREIPALIDAFGPPNEGPILDAGCGPGRQACALATRGYSVVGADVSEHALTLARRRADTMTSGTTGPDPGFGHVKFVQAAYAELGERVGSGFAGAYCLGNSLAAAGTESAAREAIRQFARCLRSGGRMFVQILNFAPMRDEVPCVKGPRVVQVDGVEYISTRQFHFAPDHVQVTNVTLWHDGAWKHHAHAGRLYPISVDEMRAWCADAGLRIDELWGGYDRSAFDINKSLDLIVVATRRSE